MFHRRAIAFVRKRDWTGMLFELLVVALGVLLGIEASNWNERRLRAAQQQAVMAQLGHEVDVTIEEADQRVASVRQLVADLAIVRAAVERGRIDPRQSARFAEGICRTTNWWQPAWRLSTVDQLIASGELDLIPDPKLRSALIGYRDTVLVIRADVLQLGNAALLRTAALNPHIDYAPAPAMVNAKTEAEAVAAPLGRCDTDLDGLRSDPAARNAVKAIETFQTTILGNQLIVAEQARQLRALLGKRR